MHPLLNSRVVVRRLHAPEYPRLTYARSSRYPERAADCASAGPRNGAYNALRRPLADLGLDAGNFDTAMWNQHPDSRIALDSTDSIEVIEGSERRTLEQIQDLSFRVPAGWADAAIC